MSRTNSSVKNLITAFIGQAAGILISFASRTVFIRCLGNDYLSLNGLFTNILTIFSLVELGVGPAMNFSLYKPLAENDIPRLKSLMALYRRAYILIGAAIGIIALIFTPFYTIFMDEVPDIPNLTLIYLLFAANSIISYFFSYKSSLIICDEKRYISTIYHYSFYFLVNLVQIIFLVTTHNYIIFLILQIIFTFGENLAVSLHADRLYPFLREKEYEPVPRDTSAEIKKNISAMMFHKLGGMAVNSTDNIILSRFAGLTSVGIYSNYSLITSALTKVINQIFLSVTAGIGNLNAVVDDSDRKRLEQVFDKLFFINFWIYGFCSCCLWVLFDPFLRLWLGDESLIFDKFTVLMIVICFYLSGMRKTSLTFREATGAFYYDRCKPIVESAINIVFSILLTRRLGAGGVFLGTIISTLATCTWIEPYVLFKHVFRSNGKNHALHYLVYTALSFFACLLTSTAAGLVGTGSEFIDFILKSLICLFVPNLLFLLCFFRTEKFRYFFRLASETFSRLFKQLFNIGYHRSHKQ